MALKVYFDLLSQPSRALILFLRCNKIPFEEKPLQLIKGEHLTEEFGNINPFYKVPAIVDGSLPLTESVGILRYLCREKQVPDHWYPKESKAQAKVDEYLEWQHLNTRLHCAKYFLAKFMLPAMQGRPPKEATVRSAEKDMVKTLDTLEDIWLAKNMYLIGNTISIADLLGACEVEQTRMTGYNPCEGRPKLTAWLNRLRQELSPHYDNVHTMVYKIAEKYKGIPPTSLSKL